MDNLETVLVYIKTNPTYLCRERCFKKNFPDLYEQILSLSFPSNFKFSQKLYHFLHDDMNLKLGICPICGKRCPYRNITLGYRHHCSPKCSAVDDNTRLKYKQTCQNVYGCDNPSKSDGVKEKRRQTCQDRFGCDTNLQCDETKEKIKQTNQFLYGCDNVFQNEEIREKSKQTKKDRYGDENYNNREKCKETCLNNYGCDNPMKSKIVQEKYRQTCQERYGHDYYMECDEFREKSKETCQEKYGMDYYSQTDECCEKMKQTNLERRGVEYPYLSKDVQEKYKQTMLELYGVEHPFQSKIIQERAKQTMIYRYGVEHYAQTHECAVKRVKKVECDSLSFDSSWEVIVYQYCQEHNIPCEYQPEIKLIYEYEGGTHVYQPDFLINNKIYEVKGDQFFDGDKMVNPYDRSKDGIFEAKHQCMIKNNIIILRKEDIERILSGENIFE